ncbi:hypothetical protein ACFE04_017528 [Oxalis oulophora]
MSRLQQMAVSKSEEGRIDSSKVIVLADLNVNPPETYDYDHSHSIHVSAPRFSSSCEENITDVVASVEMDTTAIDGGEFKRLNKFGKWRSRNKGDTSSSLDFGADADLDTINLGGGPPSSREEKVSSLKTGLVHVARKMPKNAHAHFMLGLMYQRLAQHQKAVSAYEKAAEILLRCEMEIDRPEFLSLVQIHHAQCLLHESIGNSDKELEPEELEEIISSLKESMQSDVRQALLWNTLGLLLLKTGRFESAISVLSALLDFAPDNCDCIGNLGIAHLQSGNLELSTKCFQKLILKDHNHPAALINYAANLLCQHGSLVADRAPFGWDLLGAGASACSSEDRVAAVHVSKECLLTALKADPRSAHTWVNLADAYYMSGDHISSAKCMEKAAKMEPNCMSIRYALAVHRIKDAERSQDPSEQLSWAANEMASILKEGDSVPIEPRIAWAGLAMAHKAQHEITAAFDREKDELIEVEELALSSLKQAVAEDPDDGVQWHQLGLHSLYTQQFESAQKYLKAAVARRKECNYTWSNLGISLQLSDEPSSVAENVYKRALSLATPQQSHAIFSNLGNLYRQQKQYERAKAMFSKSLELRPGYAPAFNNLGLVFVAEGQLDEAKFCFNKAIQSDPLLDVAKSNTIRVVAMSRLCEGLSSSCLVQD